MDTTLRVLVVLPMYGGSLPVGRYCCNALRELGHIIDVFEAPDFHPAYTAVKNLRVTSEKLEYLENGFLQLVSQAVTAKVETFEPDIVLALAQAPLSRRSLKKIRSMNIPTAMWFVEDYRLFTYWRAFAPYYDFFAVIQKEPFFSELKAAGVDNHLYLPMAAHPAVHKQMELGSVEKRKFGSDISFLGAGYPNRRKAFKKLLSPDFKIWGNEWDGDSMLEKYVQMGGARVSSEDAVKIFNATKINLNLHSGIHADRLVTHGDFVNPRTFELAACGAFQLVDQRTLLPELFAEDEMAVFTDMDELLDKIEYFKHHEEERRGYAERAQTRVLKEHTYACRMQTLLSFIQEKRPDLPRERGGKAAVPQDLPEDLRRDLLQLLDTLQLPADVSFKDLVRTLRQKHGTLTDLETSVLFLDEWQKQYTGA